jgi:hypothetical protein
MLWKKRGGGTVRIQLERLNGPSRPDAAVREWHDVTGQCISLASHKKQPNI